MAIANADGSIVLTTKVDQSGLKKGITTMKSGVSSLIGSFGKLAAAIGVAFSVGALVNFSKEASNLATKTESSVQRLIDIYGSASQAVGDFIDANAHALGISRSAAASYASVYGNLFSVWADQQTNASLTTHYLNMTAVVASKTGRTIEDVQERIRSGLLGNTEAIEDLGIFVNVKTIEITDAFQRIANGRSWEQLTAYEQSQVRTLAILEQATNKYGDTVEQNNALTRAQYNAAYEDFKNTWGTVVNYILMPILKVLTKVFQYATLALQAIFKISGKTISVDTSSFESQAESIESSVENQNDLTDAIKETEKEQKKALAGFDDIQILAKNETDSFDNEKKEFEYSQGSLQLPELSITQDANTIDISGYEKLLNIFEKIKIVIEEVRDIFLSGYWEAFGNADFSSIKSSLNNIKDLIFGIFENPEIQTSAKKFVVSFIKMLGQIAGSISSIGVTLATNLLGGFNLYLQSNTPFIQDAIIRIFDASEGIVKTAGNLFIAFANIISSLASKEGQLLTAKIIGIFVNAFLEITAKALEYGDTIFYYFSKPFIEGQDDINGVLLDLYLSITELLTVVEEDVSGTWDSIEDDLDSYVENIGKLWDSMWVDLIYITGEWSPILLNSVSELFDSIWKSAIEPVIQIAIRIWDDFTQILLELWEEHGNPLLEKIAKFGNETLKIFQSIYDNILEPIITPLLESISFLWNEHIKYWLKLLGDFGLDLVEAELDFYNVVVLPIVTWITEILSPVFVWLGNTVSTVLRSIARTVSSVIEKIILALKGIIDFIVGVFTLDWKKAWLGISSFFRNICLAIKNTFKGVIIFIIY